MLKLGSTQVIEILLAVRSLNLIALDDQCAPSRENLDITYDIRNMEDQTVYLNISSLTNAALNPLYRRSLTDPEKANGPHTVQWDGKPNAGGRRPTRLSIRFKARIK